MAAPVWVLSVDLQTKTATFQSGLSEAARSARGAFTDIRSGSEQAGREVGVNMMEARHGVMLLAEEFGIHLPRALVSFVTSLGPIGASMEAAFPFLAIATGATLLIEGLVKMHEAGEKLTQDQTHFFIATQSAFNQLNEKLLQAGIRADELRNDHLGALAKQLQLIDMQSMAQLAQSFDVVAAAADKALADIQSHWYTLGSGSEGVKHSLADFRSEYEALLSAGNGSAAVALLDEKLERETKILALQKQAHENSGDLLSGPKAGSNVFAAMQAQLQLRQYGVDYDEKAITSQEILVRLLNSQSTAQEKIAQLKKLEGDNSGRVAAGQAASEQSAKARASVDSQQRIADMILTADKAMANARLSIARASIAEREQSDLEFAKREMDIALAANAGQIAALNKLAADYPAQLKNLHNKAEELTQQHETAVAEITSRASIEQANQDLANLEQSERAKIAATQDGSAARIAAISAAIAEEESKQLQDTAFYRELLTTRTEGIRRAAEEQAKLQAEAGKEAADNTQKMGELALAAQKEKQALADSARRMNDQQRQAEEIAAANMEYAIKLIALSQQIAALDKSGKDYTNKLQELQNKQRQLVQQHEDQVTEIKEKAETARNQRIHAAETQAFNQIQAGLTQSILGHETWSKMIVGFGDQAVSGLIRNSMAILAQQDKERLGDAKKAASSAYAAGESMGGPLGIVLGPVFATAAFAGVMAFAEGGIVPGVGHGDIVPAMLEPGEGVISKPLMDRINAGGSGGGATTHVHLSVKPSYTLHALDHTGMETVLKQSTNLIHKHVANELRKMNR